MTPDRRQLLADPGSCAALAGELARIGHELAASAQCGPLAADALALSRALSGHAAAVRILVARENPAGQEPCRQAEAHRASTHAGKTRAMLRRTARSIAAGPAG